VALLLAEVGYLVAMNAFLATPLFDLVINATPDAVKVHYTRGWSFFPTRIHARGLSIRGTDSHVEWILRLDEVTFDCSLAALARKEFHVTRARGSGVTFRLRMKEESPAATRERVSQLPPIDSLDPVAFKPSVPPYAGTWDDAAWHLWTIRLDDTIAEHTREIWIENGRFEGDARIAGRFYLRPIRAADIGPAHVDVSRGSALLDGRTVADALLASVDFTLDRFDPRVAGSADLLHDVSLSVDARTEIPDLDAVALRLPDSGQLRGKVEIPRLALRIAKGVIRDGSHLDAHATQILATSAAHVVSGGLDVTVDVAKDRLALKATLDGLDGDLALSVPSATLSADSAALDLADPFTDLHGVADVPDAELAHAERLRDYLPAGSPLAVARGRLRASAHVEAWRGEERARGSVHLEGRDLDVVTRSLRVRGGADLEASVGSYRWDTNRASDVRGGIDVTEGWVAPKGSPDAPVLRVRGLRLAAESPELELDDPLGALRASIAVPDAEVFDRDATRALLGLGHDVRLASRRARFNASADVAFLDDRAEGTLDADAPHLGLEYEDRRLSVALHVHGRAHAASWRRGALSIDDARVEGRRLVISDERTPSALSIAHLSLAASSPRFAPSDPLANGTLVASVEEGRLCAPSALGDLLPVGSVSLASEMGGAFGADAALSVVDHVAHGAASVDARGIGVVLPRIHATGDVRVVADVARWDLASGIVRGGVGVAVENVTGGFDRPGRPPDFFADRIDLRAAATELELAHPSMRGVDYGLRVGHAQLHDARSLNAFLPSPEILRIESGTAVVVADIGTRGADHAGGGRIDVLLDQAGIGLHDTHLAGDFGVEVQARGFAPDRAELDVEGSRVAMRNVRVTGATTDTSAWNGDLVVEKGTLGLAATPHLEGDLSLQARDASPLLAILLRDTLPKFLAVLTRMPKLTATTHFVVEPDSLVLTDLFAGGGDLALRGTYVLHQQDLRAAFVIEKGPWSAGLRLGSDGMHVHLFGLRSWYGEQWREALEKAGCGAGASATYCPRE
jgi:hypothetical protein